MKEVRLNRRKNTEWFIAKAKTVHGDRYDYSKTKYVTSNDKIVYTCQEHGDKEIIPYSHLNGTGCNECGFIKRANTRSKTTEQFITEAKAIHGEKYGYDETRYVRGSVPVVIFCRACNLPFKQKPASHLNGGGGKGAGCQRCGDMLLKTTEQFIIDAKKVHGDKYDYSRAIYVTAHVHVEIICGDHSFTATPHNHLAGKGCARCAGVMKRTVEVFVEQAKRIHGNKYSYSRVTNYTDAHAKLQIECPDHGVFQQCADKHINAQQGCPHCSGAISNAETLFFDLIGIPKTNRQIRIGRYKVDGLEPETNTIYEFDGDWWHGNPKYYAASDIHPISGRSFGDHYAATVKKRDALRAKGYNLVHIWESQIPDFVAEWELEYGVIADKRMKERHYR